MSTGSTPAWTPSASGYVTGTAPRCASTAVPRWSATRRYRALAKEANRLDVADNGLCFGRLETLAGEHLYVGRLGHLRP